MNLIKIANFIWKSFWYGILTATENILNNFATIDMYLQ